APNQPAPETMKEDIKGRGGRRAVKGGAGGRGRQGAGRTPVPTETATCPWCGTASPGAICDTCGRRKARFAEPPPEEERRASVEGTITCPACFARVAREVRCSDCGMPFPLQEL